MGSCPLNEAERKIIKARFEGRPERVKGQEQLTQARNLLDTDLNANNYADKFSLHLNCEQ